MMMRRISPARGGWSVRSRVLIGMIAIVTITLVVAGATIYLLQRSALNERIDDSLRRTVGEFQVLAAQGLDTETGKAFTEANDLLYIAMQRTLPARTEGMVSFSEGNLQWTAPETVDLRLENDEEFVDWASTTGQPHRIALSSVTTATTTYRAVIVPVQLAADQKPARLVLAYDYGAEIKSLDRSFEFFIAVGAGVTVLAGIASWLMVGRMLLPVRLLRETAVQISENDLSQRIDTVGNDEFADLTITINAMLDRLETALTSQRQLLNDVGHELRTPVTIIRGHLELMDDHDPQDVTQSRDIAVDELDRMSLLIDDLVTLAKSDGPGFVAPRPVELGPWLDELLDKARGLGDRDWQVDQRADASVAVDPRRLTQAMLQLAANAVKFSGTGSAIALGSTIIRADGPGTGTGTDLLRLWVRDQGTGIEITDQQRIFERFGRGRNSTRSFGSGLGLNIVSAIVAAHEGTVEVDSAPGRGSTFTLTLPVHEENTAHEPDPDHRG